MLEMSKKGRSAKLAPSELDRVMRQIAATGSEIDDLANDLYGITDKERKMIEGGDQ
jgi:hypothetical protein